MYNPYLVIPFATWLIAQTLKFSFAAFRGKLDFRYFYASGGMPSAHSAVVASLATTTLLLDGADSALFGFTALFAAIVMYDSFGVRRASGEQAAALNMVIGSLALDKVRLADPSLKLREVLGHKPEEVAAGAVVGVLLASLFNLSKIQPQIDFLTAAPARTELIAYACLFAALIVAGWVTKVILARRYKTSRVVSAFAKELLVKTQTIGWVGLVAVFGEYEKVAYISWRVWAWLAIVALMLWDVYLATKYYRSLPAGLAAEAEEARKKKWFQMPTKRSKKRK
jgi:uncharacterized protein